MKKSIATVLAAFSLAALTVLGAAPAQAHTVPCVSKAEFGNVTRGMRMARVHRIFDIRGTQEYYFGATPYSNAEQYRHYRSCTHSFGVHGDVYVDYERRSGIWYMTSKDAFW